MVNIHRGSRGPIPFVNRMTPAHQIHGGGSDAFLIQSFHLVSLRKWLKPKNDRAAVTFRSSPAPEPQPSCAPRDYDSMLTGGVRKQDLILQGAARCPVSPFTVGVIHAISLILLCGKDTKRQGPGQGPGISNISRGNHLYLVQGFPCRFSRANICRTPEPVVCISVPVQTHTFLNLTSLYTPTTYAQKYEVWGVENTLLPRLVQGRMGCSGLHGKGEEAGEQKWL